MTALDRARLVELLEGFLLRRVVRIAADDANDHQPDECLSADHRSWDVSVIPGDGEGLHRESLQPGLEAELRIKREA